MAYLGFPPWRLAIHELQMKRIKIMYSITVLPPNIGGNDKGREVNTGEEHTELYVGIPGIFFQDSLNGY